MTTKTLPTDLDHFIGTDHLYRLPLFRGLLFTDGIKYLADEVGAHWLIDLVASHQVALKVRRQPFQLWTIRKLPEEATNMAVVECRTDTGKAPIKRQYLPYTDFPFGEQESFSWYVCNNHISGKTMMLKSEY